MTSFDWSVYKGNLIWLPSKTIYLTRHGSHAYGTSLPTSDEDFRGVAVPPKEYVYGALQRFEQAESKSPDLTVFELRKFVSLASQANPNVVEILYTDSGDHLAVTSLGEKLLNNRDLFLSKRVKHTFSGYAKSQLNRIQRHYKWLKGPLKQRPTRAEFSLPDRTTIPADQLAAANSAIRKKLDSWSTDFLDELDRPIRLAVLEKMTERLSEIQVSMDGNAWVGAARTLGFTDNFIELVDREKKYEAAKREWNNYREWQEKRNPARTELEAKWGYDTKHAMHLVRLIRMCREILETGRVNVKRPDAAELLEIRAGAWSYDRLVEWAETEDGSLEDSYKRSSLPSSPPLAKIDALCIELFEEAFEC